MPDLKSLMAAAAEQEEPDELPAFEGLARRARRRRMRTAGALVLSAALGVAITVLVLSVIVRADHDKLGVAGSPNTCSARDLGGAAATWTPRGLVLTGDLTVGNRSDAPCLLTVPSAELLSTDGRALLSEGTPVPFDEVAPLTRITLPPGQSAQAKLGWGGSYCGPTTPHAVLKVTWPDGTTLSVPVAGPVLPCLSDTTYYRHGQSAATVSGFTIR